MRARELIASEQAALTPPPEEAGLDPVPYGIYHMDLAFPAGVKPGSPQLNVIQGGSGSRKTTLMLNLLKNMFISGTMPANILTVYDTLENGMTIERLILVLRAMVASQYLIYKRWLNPQRMTGNDDATAYVRWLFAHDLPATAPLDLCRGVQARDGRPELVLTMDFIELWYRGKVQMTDNQIEAWLLAGDVVGEFPLEVNGISEHSNRDIAAKRSITTTDIEAAYARWTAYKKDYPAIQVVSDYLQTYWLADGANDPYAKQRAITPWYDRFVKETRSTLWALSQEGVTHQREYRQTGVVLGSSGGDILKSASQNNWRTSYDKENNPYFMTIHAPVKSRRGNHPDLHVMLEPASGVIFGRSRIKERE